MEGKVMAGNHRLFFRFIFLLGLTFLLVGFNAGEQRSFVFDASDRVILEGTGPDPNKRRNIKAERKSIDTPIIDFNGDNKLDFAIGSPGADLNVLGQAIQDAGAANLLINRKIKGNVLITIDGFGVAPSPGDGFGHAIVGTDVTGDGISDIVVSVPGYDSQFGENTGAIGLYLGRRGDTPAPVQWFDGTRPGGRLGTSLAFGDWNGDGFSDIAASEPFATISGKIGAGNVREYHGSSTGLTFANDWNPKVSGIKGQLKVGALYGFNLTGGDINDDGADDLFVFTPGPQLNGSVNFIYGEVGNGLRSNGNQLAKLKNKNDKLFGFALTYSFYNNDRFADPTLGTPGLDDDTGGFIILDGTASGVASTGSKLIRSPNAQPGDKSGWGMGAVGVSYDFIFAAGAPGRDVDIQSNFLVDGGAIDFFSARNGRFKFHGEDKGTRLSTGRNPGDQMGSVVGFLNDGRKRFFFFSFPGALVSGNDNAGAFYTGQVKNYDPLTFSGFKNFNANKVKGTGSQLDMKFASSYTFSRPVHD